MNDAISELAGLADRVEVLAGPDREIDVLILTTVMGYRDIHGDGYLFDQGEFGGYWSLDGDDRIPALPSPTASIDAAMALVPKGWFTMLALEDRHSHSWRWDLRGGFGVKVSSRSATPALALTAAALRAKASQ